MSEAVTIDQTCSSCGKRKLIRWSDETVTVLMCPPCDLRGVPEPAEPRPEASAIHPHPPYRVSRRYGRPLIDRSL